MKNTIAMLAISLMCAGAFAQGQVPAQTQVVADKDAVNASCTSEAQTAGCGSEVVGKGLLKCLHSYKKAHKEFKFSDSCKNSMKKLREDKKELKAENKEKSEKSEPVEKK